MASNLDIQGPDTSRAGRHVHVSRTSGKVVRPGFAGSSFLRIDPAHESVPDVARYPEKLSREVFLGVAYPLMILARRLEERLLEETFGEEYESYRQRTRRLVPFFL